MKTKKQAFTLVELIVVIVILAILGTIAFISFQGYSRKSRDGVRIADINSAKKSLEIFITKAGFYPTPDNGTNITYSGAIVWIEGTLGTNVIKNIESLNKVIIDPLTSNEYTYSITSSKTEYQIGSISEGGGLANNQTIYKTYAADLSKTSAVAYISGNYNEKFTKVNTGTTSWILAQPSIISTDKTTSTDLANILSNKKLSYNNYSNIPSSYNTPGTQSGGFNYTNPTPIIYSGTLEDLHDDNTKKLAFITNLKQAYASTDLATNPTYSDITSLDTTGDSTGAINLVISYINSNKGGIKLEQLALIGNTSSTIGGESGGGEINEYEGCTGTGQILTGLTIYRSCNASDIIICTGSGTGYTLAACNEGTNIAGTGINSYGKYFQWGNNYGFSSGTTTTTTLANATGYGPGNYYSGTYFVLGSSSYRYDWTTIQNDDLWGGVTDTNEARQGPCQNGYHIPRETEWSSIVIAGGWSSSNWTDDGIRMMNALKLPFAGMIEYTNGKVFGYAGLYSSSSFNGVNGYLLHINEDIIYPNTYDVRSRAFNIRCIKN